MKSKLTNMKELFIQRHGLKKKILICLSIILLNGTVLHSQVPAFPGAEGYGAVATGGRGGAVYEVTNLNDSGTGSLRAAIQASGARTVVFRVSGTIELQSTLKISNDNITIAGQTAPGDGICLKNYTLEVSANNVIIRYLRCRLGDEALQENDAMNGRNRSNIIIDHCSMSWSVDETASFYDNTNFTMQWCIISESLYKSIHDKGNHGYGGIWGGKGASFHHNLIAHHTSRNPRFCGSRYSQLPDQEKIDHRNNVIFNWGGNSAYAGEGGTYNMVNNYYKYGPATSSGVRDRIIGPNAQDPNATGQQPGGVWGTFYIDGNYIFGHASTTADNWIGVDPNTGNAPLPGGTKDGIKSTTEFDAPAVTTYSAEVAFEHVMAYSGAVLPKRDVVDARIVDETITGIPTYGSSFGAGKGIIDTQTDVGGWPVLNSVTPPADGDKDGMPDEWEDNNGLNKADANDGKATAGNGYTNLENYLNSLVEAFDYIIRPMHFEIALINDKEVRLQWGDSIKNETGFILERKMEGGSFVVVDSLDAGTDRFIDNEITEYATYYYRLKAFNENMESLYSNEIEALVENPIGIFNLNANPLNLMVAPNPVQFNSYIDFSLHRNNRVNLSLVDIAGKVVQVIEDGVLPAGTHTYQINADNLKSGVYFLKLSGNDSLSVVKIIIEK